MKNERTTRACMAFVMLLLAGLMVTGCGREASTSQDQSKVHSYETRGIIKTMPAKAGEPIEIRHEAVPNFKNDEGKTVPMDSMQMPFQISDDVSLEGLSEGDKIKFTFDWNWGDYSMKVTSIEKLPADTQLDLPTDAGKGDMENMKDMKGMPNMDSMNETDGTGATSNDQSGSTSSTPDTPTTQNESSDQMN